MRGLRVDSSGEDVHIFGRAGERRDEVVWHFQDWTVSRGSGPFRRKRRSIVHVTSQGKMEGQTVMSWAWNDWDSSKGSVMDERLHRSFEQPLRK